MTYQPLPGFWAAASFAERSAAYDNSKAVADSPALIAARNAEAAPFRAAPHRPPRPRLWRRPTQRLGPVSGEGSRRPLPGLHPRRLLAAQPARGFLRRSRPAPWHAAGPRRFPAIPSRPDATLTQIVGEISAALDWLQAHGAGHGIAGKVVISGWSAGGHLVGMAMPHPLVTAGLAISGIFELAPIRDTDLDEKLHLTEAEIAALSPMRLPVVQQAHGHRLWQPRAARAAPPVARLPRAAGRGACAGAPDPRRRRRPFPHPRGAEGPGRRIAARLRRPAEASADDVPAAFTLRCARRLLRRGRLAARCGGGGTGPHRRLGRPGAVHRRGPAPRRCWPAPPPWRRRVRAAGRCSACPSW